jgi:hypothetical protein
VTLGNPRGERVREVRIQDRPLDLAATYTLVGCEREGDLDDVVCRFRGVADAQRQKTTIHDVVTEYLATHSPVSPVVEGRVVATDAPSSLLTQMEAAGYSFR